MTNLIISRRCNQNCSYCFAGDQTSGGEAPDFLSIDAFEQRLDYLDRSGITQARFLGGEPTLHPQFPELVRRARAHNKIIIIFTNGLMPASALTALEELPPEQCSMILNMSATGKAAAAKISVQRRADLLKRLGSKIQPGCNIYRVNQELDSLIRLIIESGCKKAIRIGLAQPTLDGNNDFLPTRYYAQVGDQITHFAYRAAQEGIRIELDCGFVRCMFSEDAIERLSALGIELNWDCSPIIDIDTDGKVFHCFPLSTRYTSHIDQENTASDLRLEFLKNTEPYRQTGIYKKCSICRYKHELSCSGGCLSNIIRRFSSKPIHLTAHYSSDNFCIQSEG
jgi:MoaA/NifB/PqqE/SkfB family radical SAM enzyme